MRWIRKQIFWVSAAAVAGFILWQVTTAVTLNTTGADSVGKLFNRPVPIHDYVKAVQAVTHDAMLAYGDKYREQTNDQQLDDRAWQRLMLLEEARRKGVRVTDKEVVEELSKIQAFQNKDGSFDTQGYKVVMQYSLGTTPRVFEEEIREMLMIRKLMDVALGNTPPTQEELEKAYKERNESIQVDFFRILEQGLAEDVAHAIRSDPDQLEKIAKQLDRQVITTDFFKRDADIPDLTGAGGRTFGPAFDLKPGETFGPLSFGSDWIVGRLKVKQEADMSGFEAGKEELTKQVENNKKFRNYIAWYQDLLKRADIQKKKPAI